jgi:MoxR-like ATPase
MEIAKKIKKLKEALTSDLYEKEEVVGLALLTAIAGESMFLLGRPGVAKSLIARRLKFAFNGGKSFEYLMNRFSTPDEIFGPISISKLKDSDKFERLTDHYLPGADVVFLDEIWKAGPSIQNALLTVVNEKIYRNGEQETPVAMKVLISASNELPETGQGLEALWDRFLVRYVVEGITETENFRKLLENTAKPYGDPVPDELKISVEEYKEWRTRISEVTIPTEVFNVINIVRAKIQEHNAQKPDEEIYVSDRRWVKIAGLLRASAFCHGRKEVNLMDCFLIPFCLWDAPEQIEKTMEWVSETVCTHGYSAKHNLGKLQELVRDLSLEVEEQTAKKEWINKEELETTIISGTLYYPFIVDGSTRYFKKSEFDNAKNNFSSRHYPTINLYDEKGNEKSSWILIEINQSSIPHKYDFKDSYYKRYTIELKTKTTREVKITKIRPQQRLINSWESEINALKEKIIATILSVKEQRDGMTFVQEHFFVPNNYRKIVETNIVEVLKSLDVLKSDLRKIRQKWN